jgi:hypothetical protein
MQLHTGGTSMAASLPYLASYKNLPELFDRIATAKIPEKFTHDFLSTTIGLKSTNDRAFIPLLRHLGFLDQSSTPTPAYRLLKGHDRKGAIANGMKRAYAPLFEADEDVHKLPLDRLKSLVAQVGGVDADATNRISNSFSALSRLADFEVKTDQNTPDDKTDAKPDKKDSASENEERRTNGLRTEFHYNLQIHLPANGNEETYLNIFNAIRKTFQ